MAQATDAVWLPVLPSMKDFGPALIKGAGSDADKAGKSVGERFGKALVVGTAAIGAGALAAGAALYKVGEVFDEVSDTIRAGTGATGEALDGLVDIAKRVGSTVPAEFDAIGKTVADVNTRMGLSGETLEKVASQYLEAGRVLGEEVDVAATSAAFNAFGIEGEKVVGAMDHLFQVSQATGVGMNELADSASRNAPAMKTLGFSFEETTALVGSFDKAGLNSGAIMASMSKGLVALAKDGENPQKAFKRTVTEIEGFIKAGDTAGGLNLASKVFGTKGATQFIGALESGALNMSDLGKVAGQTGDSILDVGSETADFAEQWLMFKNKVLVWLEPMATQVFGTMGFLMGEVTDGVTAFGAAWEYNDGEITSSGIPGMMEVLGYWARQAFDYIKTTALPAAATFGALLADTFGPSIERVGNFIKDTLVPSVQGFGGELGGQAFTALQDVGSFLVTDLIPALGNFSTWLLDNKETIMNVATGIAVLLLPAFVRLGVTALISGAQQVMAWAMAQGGAIKTGVVYLAQSFLIIGRWVAMGAAALLSGAETVFVWGLYKIEAIKGALAHGAAAARVAAGWVVMSAAAILSGIQTAAVWTGTIIRQAAMGTVAFMISVGTIVGGWVVMGVQSLIHGARMAAAWILAMGPIGWIIIAVVALVALIIANWETISKVTVDVFKFVSKFVSDVWNNIVKWVSDAITNVVNWVQSRLALLQAIWTFVWDTIRAKVSEIWNGIVTVISDVWTKGIKPVFDTLANFITKDVPAAFEKGVGFIRSIWDGLQEIAKKPVRFVIESVINDGLINGLNNIGGLLGLPKIGRIPLPAGFRDGGYTGNLHKDKVAGLVHGDEHVIRSESRRKFEAKNPGALDHLNRHGELPAYMGSPMPGSEPFIWGGVQEAIKRTGRLNLVPHGGFPMSDIQTAARAWNGLAGVTLAAKQHQPGTEQDYGPGGKVFVGYGGMPENSLGFYIGNQIAMRRNNSMQRATIIHEVGHALGIHHNTGNKSIMHPMLNGGGATWPTAYDAANLRQLYGSPGAGAQQVLDDGGSGWTNPLTAIIEGLMKQLKDVLTGGGFIADLAMGVAKKLFDGAASWAGDKLGFGQQAEGAAQAGVPYLHDQGGVINPGLTTLVNRTRKPEALLNPQQWEDMHRLATRQPGSGGDVIFKGNVGWDPHRVAQEIEVQKRRNQTMAGMDGVVFA